VGWGELTKGNSLRIPLTFSFKIKCSIVLIFTKLD
jgi:hypothetical protein